MSYQIKEYKEEKKIDNFQTYINLNDYNRFYNLKKDIYHYERSEL